MTKVRTAYNLAVYDLAMVSYAYSSYIRAICGVEMQVIGYVLTQLEPRNRSIGPRLSSARVQSGNEARDDTDMGSLPPLIPGNEVSSKGPPTECGFSFIA